jgi:phenylacetate-CoA ligase
MNLETIYLHSPIVLQNLMCSIAGLKLVRSRYGKDYQELERAIFERENWSENRCHEYSDTQLQAIIQHAAATVPFYRKLFNMPGVNPKDITRPDNISIIPIINKKTVQGNARDFYSDLASSLTCSMVHTSGTTGAGLVFPMTLDAERVQWATWWRYRSRFGIDRHTWYAHFYGKSIVPIWQTKPPFWRINRPGRQIFFSGYHMNSRNLPYYIEELNKRKAPWIQGYPSLLAVLASFMLESGMTLGYKPKIVTIGAETLLPQQKMLIEKAFGAACRQHYGLTETVANISECPEGRLHVDEDYSYVEFIPIGGGQFKIVGTTYTNYAFPLIRYDTGDVAELYEDDVKCPCGLAGRLVKKIDGRIEDYIVKPNGTKIGRMDHIFKDMVNIKECQIFQSDVNSVVFRIVRGVHYSGKDEEILIREARKRLGDDIEIKVPYVKELERTARGKLRFVISTLPQARIQQDLAATVKEKAEKA